MGVRSWSCWGSPDLPVCLGNKARRPRHQLPKEFAERWLTPCRKSASGGQRKLPLLFKWLGKEVAQREGFRHSLKQLSPGALLLLADIFHFLSLWVLDIPDRVGMSFLKLRTLNWYRGWVSLTHTAGCLALVKWDFPWVQFGRGQRKLLLSRGALLRGIQVRASPVVRVLDVTQKANGRIRKGQGFLCGAGTDRGSEDASLG